MTTINRESTPAEIAAIVSEALQAAGIPAILTGGSAVTVYTQNDYQSKDLDFVTADTRREIAPVMESIGFMPSESGALSQYDHPDVDWYVEFVGAPLTFGETYARLEDSGYHEVGVGTIRIITPTQSVMDRLTAYFNWNDSQSMDQAVMVATRQQIDWDQLEDWFRTEGRVAEEFERFKALTKRAQK